MIFARQIRETSSRDLAGISSWIEILRPADPAGYLRGAPSRRPTDSPDLRKLPAMFGAYGFDPKRDIAGLIPNRWGHAYVVPQPGFYFGRDGKPAPREVVRKGYGRVRFEHSELTGFQLWHAAARESGRCGR